MIDMATYLFHLWFLYNKILPYHQNHSHIPNEIIDIDVDVESESTFQSFR